MSLFLKFFLNFKFSLPPISHVKGHQIMKKKDESQWPGEILIENQYFLKCLRYGYHVKGR
jgi:hypothetical protein